MTRRLLHIYALTILLLLAAIQSQGALRTFGSKQGLEDNFVTSVAADSTGMVYLSSTSGIYSFDGLRLRPLPTALPDSLSSLRFITDRTGNLTGLHSGKAYRFDGKSFSQDETGLNNLPALIGHNITDMYISSGGIHIIADNDTLYRADRACSNASAIGPAFGHTRIAMADGRIWLYDGMKNGAIHYPASLSGKQPTVAEELTGYLVKAICGDREGNITAGTNSDGLLRLKRATAGKDTDSYTVTPVQPTTATQHMSAHISALLCGERSVYIGTSKAGLQILTDIGCSVRNIPTGIMSDIAFIREDSLGNLWVGYDGAGLHVFDGLDNMRQLHPFDEKDLPSQLVIGVSGGKGKRWFGTYGNGLFSIEDSEVSLFGSGSPTFCRHIHSFPDGRLLAGTFTEGLFFFDRHRKPSHRYLHGECITGMTEYNGKIAVAVSGAVHIFDPSRATLTKLDLELPTKNGIRCILSDSRRLLWVGTTSGIAAYDAAGERVFSADATDGLSNRIVRAMTEDREGNIWLTTATGIDRLSPEALSNGSLSFRLFSIRPDDIPGDADFNRYAICATDNGHIIAGAGGELIEVNTEDIYVGKYNSRPFITGIMVDGRYIAPGDKVRGGRVPLKRSILHSDEIRLEYYHGLTLEFSTLDPATAATSVYEFKMDKGNWTTLATPSLTLAELTPGKHTLSVRIAGGEQDRVISIDVAPPFWRSTWAYMIYAALVLSVAWWSYRRLTGEYKKEILNQSIKTIDAREKRTQPTQEELFLAKARTIVEENISDEEFTVETFAEKMAMSRSNLYKKMNAITGNSPIEFLRLIRIQKGKAIIDEGEEVISQVAFQVGLSPKVFSKYFKEEYGVTPSKYISEADT